MENNLAPNLSGKLAVVTGGGRGIGLAIAGRLLRLGCRVLAAGRDASALAKAGEGFAAFAGRFETVACDVSREEEAGRLFAAADAAGRLDILVNNAGVGIAEKVVDADAGEFDRLMAVNARSVLLCGREAMRRMAGRGGRIVNIASVAGLRGFENEAAYCASKHAVMGLGKVMALEGRADGIVVQTVCTAGVATDMVKIFRPDVDMSALISPEDVAEAVEFLLGQRGNAYTDVLTLRRGDDVPYSG